MDIHIIDDDRATLLLYSKIAQNYGFSSASFSNAENYLKSMARSGYQPPIIILTDIEMPGINGYQLMSKVRESYPHQRFVVNSGNPEMKSGEQLACLYFSKPVSKQDLQSAFLELSKCVECGLHPDCTDGKTCIADNRTQFNIEDWKCPFKAH